MTQLAKKTKNIFFENFENFNFFWPFFALFGKIRIFPKNLIRPFFAPYIPLTSCKKSEKSNDVILKKKFKNLIFGPFLALFGQIRIFMKNRAPSLFIIYGPLTSWKKSEKSNEPILRKVRDGRTDWLTDWRTDRSDFIGPLNFSSSGPKTKQKQQQQRQVVPHSYSPLINWP